MEGLEKVWGSGRRASRNLSRSISRNMSRGNWGVEDVFMRSSRSRRSGRGIDDDEEALRWAAIEKLPTYDRLRTSILQSYAEGETSTNQLLSREVDVRKLNMEERQEFIERLFKVAEEDNERFLRKFRNRIDNYTHKNKSSVSSSPSVSGNIQSKGLHRLSSCKNSSMEFLRKEAIG